MDDVQKKYEAALQSLITKVQADPYILAAVLMGSLSHDSVWDRSDIDLLLVTQEIRLKRESICLVESGINIHTYLKTRSEFRKVLEGSVQGSFTHSLLLKGRMLFSREETLTELFEARHRLSERDRSIQLLSTVSTLLPGFTKAEKWFYAKRDFDYCAFWALWCANVLARIEVLLHGEVPGREVIQRALTYNPDLFHVLYTDLLRGKTAEEDLARVLVRIREYLHLHRDVLFELLLSYLREEGVLRSMSDIEHYFQRNYQIEAIELACEWLADEGVLRKMAAPIRLTDKSRVDVEEAAYYLSDEPLR